MILSTGYFLCKRKEGARLKWEHQERKAIVNALTIR